MASMSYCKFENTSNDMSQCIDGLWDEDLSSNYERRARIRLIKQCAEMLEAIGVDIDGEQLENGIAQIKELDEA